MVDVAGHRQWSADSAVDDRRNFKLEASPVEADTDSIADTDSGGGLGIHPVDLDVSAAAGLRRRSARADDSDRPQPTVDAGLLHDRIVARYDALRGREQGVRGVSPLR